MALTDTIPTSTIPPSSSAVVDVLAECTSAIPGWNGNVPVGACNSYYNFDPKFAPAVATAVIFGILTLTHLILGIVHRKRYSWVLIMGALWETTAFVLHSLGSLDQQQIGYSISHTIIYFLAPLWINAFVYMTLSRMVYLYIPDQKVWIFRATLMSVLFVWADIATFIVQAVGGTMLSPGAPPTIIQAGLTTYCIGIGIQLFFIVIFIGLMIGFQRTCRRIEASEGVDGLDPETYRQLQDDVPKKDWKWTLYGLYVVLTFIGIRIIFRLAEFAGGMTPSNPIPFHEEYSYALDAFPMMVCLLVLAILHPGRILQGPNSEFPRKTRKEKKAEKKAKKDQQRVRKEEKRDKKAAEKERKRNEKEERRASSKDTRHRWDGV